MPRKTKKSAMATNQAVALKAEDKELALKQIAFGSEWDEFETQIEERIIEYTEDDPVKQSTRRALGMIREMMFQKL